jgi:hypothetical protein
MDHSPRSRMPEHGGQQTVDRPARRRGAPGLEQLPREIGEIGGTDIPYGEVTETLPDCGRAGLPGEQAAGTCLRVTTFRGEPHFDRFRDRLALSSGDPREVALGLCARPACGSPGDLAAPLLPDQPDASARVPLVLRMAAFLGDRRHEREVYQMNEPPRGVGRESGHENDAISGEFLTSKDVVVPAKALSRADQPAFRGESAESWHVAYWDDVLWWVTDRLDRIDPQLWRVAP